MARALAGVAPDLPRVAVGLLAQPEGAIAALRAGVTDFVDVSTAPHDVPDVVQRLLRASHARASARHSHSHCDLLLMGARAGVGTSTLAAHLATIAHARHVQAARLRKGPDRALDASTTGRNRPESNDLPLSSRAALLDLGWPIGDAQLYVNVADGFDFAEAARNLQRLDATLLGSAMAHTSDGLSLMAWPHDSGQMHHVSQSDLLLVFERLRQNFGLIITDSGGFSSIEFVAALARASQVKWLVTDQSVSSLVALSSMLQILDQHQVERSSLRLIVNRYDERYGMTAKQIAGRFQIELLATLPDRTLALMMCTNQGRLLHQEAERDPYVRGVQGLADLLCADTAQRTGRSAGWLANMLPSLSRRQQAVG